MKYLKQFDESKIERGPGFNSWYRSTLINLNCIRGEYKINEDETIYVDGNVNLFNKKLFEMPVKFGDVSGNFHCFNNFLTNLKGCPVSVGGRFECSNNKLTSLEGSPLIVRGNYFCNNNELYNFYGIGKVEGLILCNDNPVDEIYGLCRTNEFVKYLNEFRPIRGKTILGKRLEECLYMCDVTDIDVSKLQFKNYTLLE